MKKVSGLTALGFMLAIIFAAALPAWAESVDQRISTLEAELARLKAEQVEVKSEQIELRKNALAAEGALPTFTYRPAAGLRIEAADKSWSIRFAMEAHMRMLFESGRSHAGRTNGEVQGRRFRPRWNFCVVNCFYEIELAYDNDGFGGNSAIQRGAVWVHLEQISPWLPTFYLGLDIPSSTGEFPDGDGFTGWQMEKPLILRGLPNTGSASNGFGFNWDDKPLSSIGIPGKITRINFAVAGIAEAGEGTSTFLDAGHNMLWYINVAPFSELKSKWLEGFEFEMGYWLCKIDRFEAGGNVGDGQSTVSEPDQDCARLRLRDNGDGGRTTLFDTGTGVIGRGPMHYLYPGVQWEIGPYTLRATGQFARWKNGQDTGADTRPGHTKANGFNIAHDLWLFSPKGWLTGSPTTPGSVLVGTRFERSTADCNYGGGGPGLNPAVGKTGGCTNRGFNRIIVLVREWGVYYFLMNRMSVGINWTWYDASNIPTFSLANLGILNHPTTARGGSWVDVALNFRVRF
ncbi:MAG TPA: hypothetical protein VGL70_15010 [Candidatus Binatia bacterium]